MGKGFETWMIQAGCEPEGLYSMTNRELIAKASLTRHMPVRGEPILAQGDPRFVEFVHASFLRKGIRHLLPTLIKSLRRHGASFEAEGPPDTRESLRARLFFRLCELDSLSFIDRGGAHRIFTALAFVVKELVNLKQVNQYKKPIMSEESVYKLWREHTEVMKAHARTYNPGPGAAPGGAPGVPGDDHATPAVGGGTAGGAVSGGPGGALAAAPGCAHHAPGEKSAMTGSKSVKDRLWVDRYDVVVLPQNEVVRAIGKGLAGLSKRQLRDFQRKCSRLSEKINPVTHQTSFGSKRMVDLDAVVLCVADVVRMVDEQQLWAFQRLYRRLRRKHLGQPEKTFPRKLELAVRAMTGTAMCEGLFYHLYARATVRLPPEHKPEKNEDKDTGEEWTQSTSSVGTATEHSSVTTSPASGGYFTAEEAGVRKTVFNPTLFASLLLDRNLDLSRLVSAYRILPWFYRHLNRMAAMGGTGTVAYERRKRRVSRR